MGPSQKRARTKPPKVEELIRAVEGQPLITPVSSSPAGGIIDNVTSTAEDCHTRLKEVKGDGGSEKQLKSKDSWYGTWPRKSKASTQLARETILADKQTIPVPGPDLSRFEPIKPTHDVAGRPPSMSLGKSKDTSDITLGGTLEDSQMAMSDTKPKALQLSEQYSKSQLIKDSETSAPEPSEIPAQLQPETDGSQRPVTASSWLGWLSRPGIQPPTKIDESRPTTEQLPTIADQAQQVEQPVVLAEVEDVSMQSTAPVASTSWFGLWPRTELSTLGDAPVAQVPINSIASVPDTVMEDAPALNLSTEIPAGSSWAFWSTDAARKGVIKNLEDSQDSAMPTVAGEPSPNRPDATKAAAAEDAKKTKSSKRGRTQSVEIDESSRKAALLNSSATKGTPSQSPAPLKTAPPNLLIPSVRSTYSLVENPSILQQIARLLLYGQQHPAKHVFLVKDPPKIKRAVAIGIHGLFPAPLLRTVIGQPTGTSIRFANHAAAAIRRWTDQHGSLDCEIEKVALEGEGKIAERVDNLWKLLLNWIDHVRKADFILVACHSQGVPVALMLVAKLIEFGVVSTARVGVCAMAGASLGPFADYKSRLFSGSAGELFEFADPESGVSKRYEDSLRVAMKYGVRVAYCGSIDDQLISMESAIFSTASHPYIYRAVFVDGRIHAPDFLAHLVGLALKLRNLGVSDHGLIRELSAPLAGSLYTGEGHSRLYDDEKVYDLSVEYALETTSVGDVPLEMKKYEIPTNLNPYVLPWIMRGLLEEDFVKTELSAETMELLKQFDDWKPATKILKDVKYRLEAVRSKL